MNRPTAPNQDHSTLTDARHSDGGSEPRFRGYAVTLRRISVGGRNFELIGPADADGLADDPRVAERFEHDEYMPYWAEFWSSSLLLAEHISSWKPLRANEQPLRLLDLGCGLGLAGVVASLLGYEVTFADYDEDALAFAVENARRNGATPPQALRIDWRETYSDLKADRIVAGDVLYESRSLRPVAEFIKRHLAPAGTATLADPNRTTAEGFEQIARHCGLSISVRPVQARKCDGSVASGRMFHLGHKDISQISR